MMTYDTQIYHSYNIKSFARKSFSTRILPLEVVLGRHNKLFFVSFAVFAVLWPFLNSTVVFGLSRVLIVKADIYSLMSGIKDLKNVWLLFLRNYYLVYGGSLVFNAFTFLSLSIIFVPSDRFTKGIELICLSLLLLKRWLLSLCFLPLFHEKILNLGQL